MSARYEDEAKSYGSGAGYGAGSGSVAGAGASVASGAAAGELEQPTIELEHAIGFTGCVPGGLRYHPNGTLFVVCNHNQLTHASGSPIEDTTTYVAAL